MLQIYHDQCKFVYEEMQERFTHDLIDEYFKIAILPASSFISYRSPKDAIPSEEELLTSLEVWGKELVSFYELNGDPLAYLEYEDEDHFNLLMYDNHYQLFRHDVILIARRNHLSMYLEKEKTHINMPITEVW